jgi:hypothetical protein
VYDLFAERLRVLVTSAARQDNSLEPVSDLVLRALVGGIGELVQRHILTAGAASLGELTPALAQLAIRMLEGAPIAAARP